MIALNHDTLCSYISLSNPTHLSGNKLTQKHAHTHTTQTAVPYQWITVHPHFVKVGWWPRKLLTQTSLSIFSQHDHELQGHTILLRLKHGSPLSLHTNTDPVSHNRYWFAKTYSDCIQIDVASGEEAFFKLQTRPYTISAGKLATQCHCWGFEYKWSLCSCIFLDQHPMCSTWMCLLIFFRTEPIFLPLLYRKEEKRRRFFSFANTLLPTNTTAPKKSPNWFRHGQGAKEEDWEQQTRQSKADEVSGLKKDRR